MEGKRAALAEWLRKAAGAKTLSIVEMDKLSGGAIQENWGLRVCVDDALQDWVLRTDAPSGVATSHGRVEEFALLKAAYDAGVTVPRPLYVNEDPGLLGKPFYVMGRIEGRAEGHIVTRDPALQGEAGDRLAEQLGRELACIHAIRPPRADLGFLPMPDVAPALYRIATYRSHLDTLDPNPPLEYVLRRLELRAPQTPELVLCHSDFRTGNYMISDGRLTGILDWEFAAWSDPMEDIGWFCYRYWRFGADEREAGGIGSREAFYRGYEAEAGRSVDQAVIPYWEVMAAVRWAVIALQQGERHLSGGEESLELVLTALRAPEMELDALLGIARMEGKGMS